MSLSRNKTHCVTTETISCDDNYSGRAWQCFVQQQHCDTESRVLFSQTEDTVPQNCLIGSDSCYLSYSQLFMFILSLINTCVHNKHWRLIHTLQCLHSHIRHCFIFWRLLLLALTVLSLDSILNTVLSSWRCKLRRKDLLDCILLQCCDHHSTPRLCTQGECTHTNTSVYMTSPLFIKTRIRESLIFTILTLCHYLHVELLWQSNAGCGW